MTPAGKTAAGRRAIIPAVSASQNRPLVGIGVVFVRDGRVFLARRQGSHGAGAWASAGGHLEYGETPEECARREAYEELGLTVGNLRLLCVSNIIAYGRHYLDLEFLGDIGTQEPIPSPTDHSFGEHGWFPLDDPPAPLFQPMRLAIASLRSGQRYFTDADGDSSGDAPAVN